MMDPRPPTPALSPPLDGHIPLQKGDPLSFFHTPALKISHPPSPQATSDHYDPSSPVTSADYTPRVDNDEEGVFKGPSPCAESAPQSAAGTDHSSRHRRTKPQHFSEKRSYPRISRPVELMRNSYDYVVIGSGYGGAVAASRLARSVGVEGRNSVCVLERGIERWPGEYPADVADGVKNLHISGELTPGELKGIPVDSGDPDAMYRLILGKGLSAVVGSGKYLGSVLAMDKR